MAKAIRTILLVLTLLVVAWSFFDVGRRVVGRWAQQAERPVTLTILHWGNKEEEDIVEDLKKDFEKANPKVRVVRIHASSFDSKLKTMMAAGTPPDLFYLPPRLLPELASLGLIRPIDEQVEKLRGTPDGKAYLDDIYPVLIDAFRYDTTTGKTGDGKLYALPKDSTTAVFYVNVDLFEKAGLKVPYDGWTWDEFADACRKITALGGKPRFEGRQIYGGNFQIWGDTLRNVVWTFGGDFFGPGGFSDVALDEPAAQEALEFIRRLRIDEKVVYNPTGVAREGGQEFFTGNIGIHGPVGRWMAPRYKDIKGFRWDVVPVPAKRPELRASQLFYTGWTMSSATKHPDEAFALMKFLCGPDGARRQSELGLAIPPLKSVANSPAFLSPPGFPAHRAEVFLQSMEVARIQQLPREQEWGAILDGRVGAAIALGRLTTAEVAAEIESVWKAELGSPLRKREWGAFPWTSVLSVTAGVIVTAVAALVWKARRERLGAIDRATERAGFMFIAPWLIGFALLTAGPMVMSLLLSFSKWSAMTPVADAKWVGIGNYLQAGIVDPAFYKSLKVTLYFVVLSVPISQAAALAVALLMNAKVKGIAFFRTIYFVPSVVSGVALAVLWLQIFNNDYGLLNRFLRELYGWLLPLAVLSAVVGAVWAVVELARKGSLRNLMAAGSMAVGGLGLAVLFVVLRANDIRGVPAPDWFGKDIAVWGIPAFVIMGLWGVGGGMIIYLAGLKGIPVSLYEAATIDGAGALRKFWNVTLPMLSPLVFYNLVMGIIGSFQVFTQVYVMTGRGDNDSTLVYVLNLYQQAFEFHNMGYASALAWVLFVICLGLTILVFRGSRKLVYYEGLR